MSVATDREIREDDEQLLTAMLGALVAAGLWVWASGMLAAWLWTGETPQLSAVDLAKAMWRLPSHLSDPAAAYGRPQIPGPWQYWPVAIGVLGLTAGVPAWAWGRARCWYEAQEAAEGARWARPRDLRALRVAAPRSERITLGRRPRGLVRWAGAAAVRLIRAAARGLRRLAGGVWRLLGLLARLLRRVLPLARLEQGVAASRPVRVGVAAVATAREGWQALTDSRIARAVLWVGRLLRRAWRHRPWPAWLVAAEARQAVAVFGPARSGKTSGLVIPAILEWDGPVIATSVRDDLVAATLATRSRRGQVWLYDPTDAVAAYPSCGWDPLGAATTWAGAQRMAAAMAQAGRAGAELGGDSGFWYGTAAKLLAPLLLAAATGGYEMRDVVRWVDRQEEDEVAKLLEDLQYVAALDAAEASWRRAPRQRSSAYTTCEQVLRAFADPVVADSCHHDLTPTRLLDGGANTLYVSAPAHEQARLQPVFVALLQQVIHAAFDRQAAGEDLDRPLLIVLDEAANIAPLPDLPQLASTAAGAGIQLVTVWQDFAQVVARYGSAQATSIVNNHRAKLGLSGISDADTLLMFDRLAGQADASLRSEVWNGRSQDPGRPPQRRPLAPSWAVRQLEPGQAMLVYGHLPPARVELRPWFEGRGLWA